ncbi:hypothetical protein RKD32_007060 [Streptomyces sp. SAI-195]
MEVKYSVAANSAPVLRAYAGDGEAVIAAPARVRPGDDHHALALAVEDPAGCAAVAALGDHRGEDLQPLAPVEGEGAGVRLGLGPDQTLQVLGRPAPVDADVLGGPLVEEARLRPVLPGELRLSGRDEPEGADGDRGDEVDGLVEQVGGGVRRTDRHGLLPDDVTGVQLVVHHVRGDAHLGLAVDQRPDQRGESGVLRQQ